MKPQNGFSLIELMVTIAVIGILSVVAVPAYSNYTIRGKIPDATSNLAIKRVAMEQAFQDSVPHVYSACATDTTSGQYYTFSCSSTDNYATTYIITATGGNTAKNDTSMSGFTYTIDQNNNKTSTIVAPANSSWIATSNSCWITKPGGVC